MFQILDNLEIAESKVLAEFAKDFAGALFGEKIDFFEVLGLVFEVVG